MTRTPAKLGKGSGARRRFHGRMCLPSGQLRASNATARLPGRAGLVCKPAGHSLRKTAKFEVGAGNLQDGEVGFVRGGWVQMPRGRLRVP